MQVSDLRCSVRSGHQPTWHAWEKASLLQLMQWHRGTCISIASTPERKVALRSVYLPYPQPLLDSLEAVAKTQLTCEKEGLSSAPPNCRPHPTPRAIAPSAATAPPPPGCPGPSHSLDPSIQVQFPPISKQPTTRDPPLGGRTGNKVYFYHLLSHCCLYVSHRSSLEALRHGFYRRGFAQTLSPDRRRSR